MGIDQVDYAKTDAGAFNVLNANVIGFDSLANSFLRVRQENSGNVKNKTKLKRTSVVLLMLRFVADQSVYLPTSRRKIQVGISRLLSRWNQEERESGRVMLIVTTRPKGDH